MTITVSDMGYRMDYDTKTGSVSICHDDGRWAGDGRYESGRIVDCSAHIGDSEDESEDVYVTLEVALKTVLEARAFEREQRVATLRARFVSKFSSATSAGLWEDTLLSSGRAFLPACARKVLDGKAPPTQAYCRYLLSQIRELEATGEWQD